MRPEVRSARPEEIGDLAEIMRVAGIGPNVNSLLRYTIRSQAGDVFVATWGGRIVGGVAVLSLVRQDGSADWPFPHRCGGSA